jgi:uncharacterized membrane protein
VVFPESGGTVVRIALIAAVVLALLLLFRRWKKP